ncbi:MAG TPA: hypothetical protein VGL81_17785 [Polyangiaceae bacterium]|jgi:hypothetical protein
MRSRLLVGGFVCLAAACGGHTVNLGAGGDGGASPGDDAGGSGSSSGSAGSNPLSGTYKGYIESFKFPDGSDTVVLTLVFGDDGGVTGTVFFGDGPPLAPPMDPNVGYPPGLTVPPGPTDEGFSFTVLGGSYAAPRLTLGLDLNELWKQWCQIQTTIYPWNNGAADGGCGPLLHYACLPNGSTQTGAVCSYTACDETAPTTVDCGKLALCGGMGPDPCTCTATSCTVATPTQPGITFDMQLNAGALDGSETGIGNSVLNVHLTKQP